MYRLSEFPDSLTYKMSEKINKIKQYLENIKLINKKY